MEYRTSNKQCALLSYSSAKPTDCPDGCVAHSGNKPGTDITKYTGNGNSDNVCMHPHDTLPQCGFDTGTGRFTAPVKGYYTCAAQVRMDFTTHSSAYTRPVKILQRTFLD